MYACAKFVTSPAVVCIQSQILSHSIDPVSEKDLFRGMLRVLSNFHGSGCLHLILVLTTFIIMHSKACVKFMNLEDAFIQSDLQ